MRPIRARFDRPAPPPRWMWRTAVAMLVLAGMAAAGAWVAHLRLESARAAMAAAADNAERERRAPDQAARTPPAYDESARAMLKERAVPWPSALTAIENVSMPSVTPTAIEFAANEGAVRLEVAFSDHAELLEYVGRLNEGLDRGVVGWRWSVVQTRIADGGAASAPGTATVSGRWR